MILPLRVRGSVSRNAISFGATAGAEALSREAEELASRARRSAREPALERDERLHDFHRDGVRLADDAGLGDGGVLEQRALDLERADEVSGRLDDVVRATDEPEVAVGVAPREIAGQVPLAREALGVALRSSR